MIIEGKFIYGLICAFALLLFIPSKNNENIKTTHKICSTCILDSIEILNNKYRIENDSLTKKTINKVVEGEQAKQQVKKLKQEINQLKIKVNKKPDTVVLIKKLDTFKSEIEFLTNI